MEDKSEAKYMKVSEFKALRKITRPDDESDSDSDVETSEYSSYRGFEH